MKIKYKQIAKSLTGFSTPVFGVSWNSPQTDRKVARKLIAFFEDRRALYNPFDLENPRYVIDSVVEIRRVLTETIQMLDEDSDMLPHVRAMRAACRKFMNEVGDESFPHFDFFASLGELRGIFGVHMAQLSVKYGIDVEEELALILPIEDDETSKPIRRKLGF